MENSMQSLEWLLKQSIIPHVLVVTTEAVENACQKSGMRLIDFLNPFSSFDGYRNSIKGTREEPYLLMGFRVKLLEPAQLCLSHSQGLSSQRTLASIVERNLEGFDLDVTEGLIREQMKLPVGGAKTEGQEEQEEKEKRTKGEGGKPNRIHRYDTPCTLGDNKQATDFQMRCQSVQRSERSASGFGGASSSRSSIEVDPTVFKEHRMFQPSGLTPWARDFRYWLFHSPSTGCTEFEYLQHPVACIFVVSASSQDPPAADVVTKFDRMYEELLQHPSGLWRHGIADPNLFNIHVILRDAQDPSSDRQAEEKFAAIKKAYPSDVNCLLSVNSGPRQPDGRWSMSVDDQRAASLFMQDSITRIVSHLEKRVKLLEEQVAATRKNFKNQMRSFFRIGGSKQKAPPESVLEAAPSGLLLFGLNTPLAQARMLADLLFLLRDYDSAQSNYKNCLLDYKADRTQKFTANCYDMLALCYCCLSESQEAEKQLEKAIETYLTVPMMPSLLVEGRAEGPDDQISNRAVAKYLQRAMWLLFSLKIARGKLLDAATVATRAASQCTTIYERLNSIGYINERGLLFRQSEWGLDISRALFFEQAAFCHLFGSQRPRWRTFALHLIHSADSFGRARLSRHSLSTFSCALSAFSGRQWDLLDDHLLSSMARQAFLLGGKQLGCDLMFRLLSRCVQPSDQQTTYVREFMSIFDQLRPSTETLALLEGEEGPLLTQSSLVPLVPFLVISESNVRLNAQYAISKLDDPLWWKMEEWLVYEESREAARLNSKNFKLSNYYRPIPDAFRHHSSPVGETFRVELSLKNPLLVPLQLLNVQFLVDHFDLDDQLDDTGRPARPLTSSERAISVDQQPHDVLLEAGKEQKFSFLITPRREGLLEIRSVGFQLGNGAWGRVDLPVAQRRLFESRQYLLQKAYEPNLSTSVQISSPMPHLLVDFPEKLPSFVLQNEVLEMPVLFKNIGHLGFKNLRLKVSDPGFFSAKLQSSPPASPSPDRPDCYLSRPGSSPSTPSTSSWATQSQDFDLSILRLEEVHLNPGESTTRSLFFRARKTGILNFKLLFYYEPDAPEAKEMPYRLHRHQIDIRVLPSLNISYEIRPSPSALSSYLVQVNVQNLQTNAAFFLRQICAVSSSWRLEPLSYRLDDLGPLVSAFDPALDRDPFFIGPKQKLFLVFRCVPVSPSDAPPSLSPSNPPLLHTNLFFNKEGLAVPLNEGQWLDFFSREARPGALTYNSNYSMPRKDIARNISMVDGSSLSLQVLWQAAKLNRFGQHIVLNAPISLTAVAKTLTSSMAPRAPEPVGVGARERRLGFQDDSNSLRYSISAPDRVVHDFASQRILCLPVEVSVRNLLRSSPLSFFFETIRPDDTKELTRFLSDSRMQFFWAGSTKQSVRGLEPDGEVKLKVLACFFEEGVFDLNRVQCVITREGEPDQPIVCNFQKLITISSPSSSSSS